MKILSVIPWHLREQLDISPFRGASFNCALFMRKNAEEGALLWREECAIVATSCEDAGCAFGNARSLRRVMDSALIESKVHEKCDAPLWVAQFSRKGA